MFDIDLSAIPTTDLNAPAPAVARKPRAASATKPAKVSLRSNDDQTDRIREIGEAIKANDLDKIRELAKGWTLNKNEDVRGYLGHVLADVKTAEQLDAVLTLDHGIDGTRHPPEALAKRIAGMALRTSNSRVIGDFMGAATEQLIYAEGVGTIAYLDAAAQHSTPNPNDKARWVENAMREKTHRGTLANAVETVQYAVGLPNDMTKYAGMKDVAYVGGTRLLNAESNVTAEDYAAAAHGFRAAALKAQRKVPYYLRDDKAKTATAYATHDAPDDLLLNYGLLKAVDRMLHGKSFDVQRMVANSLDNPVVVPYLAARFEAEPELRKQVDFSQGMLSTPIHARGGLSRRFATVDELGLAEQLKATPLTDFIKKEPMSTFRFGVRLTGYSLGVLEELHEREHPGVQSQASFELAPHLCKDYTPAEPYLLTRAAFNSVNHSAGYGKTFVDVAPAFLAGPNVKVDITDTSLIADLAYASNMAKSYGRPEPSSLLATLRDGNFDKIQIHPSGNLLSDSPLTAAWLLDKVKEGELPAHKVQAMVNQQDLNGNNCLHSQASPAAAADLALRVADAGLDATHATHALNKAGQLPEMGESHHGWNVLHLNSVKREQAEWLLAQGAMKVTPLSRATVTNAAGETMERITLGIKTGQGTAFTATNQLMDEAAHVKYPARNPLSEGLSLNKNGSVNIRVKSLDEAEKAIKDAAILLVRAELARRDGKPGEFMPEGWVAAQELPKAKAKGMER